MMMEGMEKFKFLKYYSENLVFVKLISLISRGFFCPWLVIVKFFSKGEERYEKFEKWQQQAQKLKELSDRPQDVAYPKLMENIKNEILCHKEMYKLVQIRKPSR